MQSRPIELSGVTYKFTPPEQPSFYITINDIEVDGIKRPFEIFINSKNLEHFQWIVALTLAITAVFRSGEDVSFLVKGLKSIFDPRGGYWQRGGRYLPSIVAQIGECIELHLQNIGLIEKPVIKPKHIQGGGGIQGGICPKCQQPSLIKQEGCDTCLECGYSKCG